MPSEDPPPGDKKQEEKAPSGDRAGNAGSKGEKEEGKSGGEKAGSKPFRPSRTVIVIGIVVIVILVIGAFLYWLHARQFVSTDDAYTTSHVHEVSTRVTGLVAEVRVDDNQMVKAGDVLVTLDARDYEAGLQRAQAALTQAEAQVGSQVAAVSQSRAGVTVADAQIEQSRAQVVQAAAQLEKARLDYERVSSLYTKDLKAVSKADVDAATANVDSARGAWEGARAALAGAAASAESSRANLEAAEAQIAVAKANVSSARAVVRNAELQLSYTRIGAPVDGKVSKKTVEVGQQIQPGQALLAVVPEDVWVVANLKETQLEEVRVGQRVDVKIDSLPHQIFYGSVHSIQEGSGATFSLLPPDNATGNFTKIVQRVPVKIVFDPESIRDFRDLIIPGLSVEPKIDLRSLRDNRREPKRTEREQKQNQKYEEGR